jgi:hypothetical protein
MRIQNFDLPFCISDEGELTFGECYLQHLMSLLNNNCNIKLRVMQKGFDLLVKQSTNAIFRCFLHGDWHFNKK